MEEEGQIYKVLPQIFLIFAPGLSYDLSKFGDDFTPCFDFERPQLSPWAKIKKSEATFVAMNMMNKCDKFHKDSLSGKKVKFNLPSVIEFSETADFVHNFV